MSKCISITAFSLALLIAACSKAPSAGDEGSVQFIASALSAADVALVSLEVSGPGITPSITSTLARTNDTWQGTIAHIPVGPDRLFRASAFDAGGTLRYRGEATGAIAANTSTVVVVTMQQVNAPPPFANAAPIIDSIVMSAAHVTRNSAVAITVTAHDPNGDPVTYAWTASRGAFDSSSAPAVNWTAPATDGVDTLAVQVSDPLGLRVGVGLTVTVGETNVGAADVVATVNTWPNITNILASPTRIDVGESTTLGVVASDSDGDAMTYAWSATCAGNFNDASAAMPSFTLSALPAGGSCTLSVLIRDGRGGQNTGSVTIVTGPQVTPTTGQPGFCSSDAWCVVSPLPQGNQLNKVIAFSANDVWISGEAGTLIHWNGTTFQQMPSPVINGVGMLTGTSSSDLWAGNLDNVYHWNGSAWTLKFVNPDPVNDFFTSMYAVSSDNIWLISTLGVLYHFTTGPSFDVWPQRLTMFDAALDRIFGSGANDLWVLGHPGVTLHFDGTTWTRGTLPTLETVSAGWSASPTQIFTGGMSGHAYRGDGTNWTPDTTAPPMFLSAPSHIAATHGTSASDVWQVGANGMARHFDGVSWSAPTVSNTPNQLNSVFARTSSDVWAVGSYGTIIHWNGSTWTNLTGGVTSGEPIPLRATWGTAANDIWSVGPDVILHYDGTAWMRSANTAHFAINAVHGNGANDVFAVGQKGTVTHWDGSVWTTISLGDSVWLNGLWTMAANDAWAVGTNLSAGYIARWNGTTWSPVASNTTSELTAVFATSASNAWAVGYNGTIVHWGGSAWTPVSVAGVTATLNAVWGASANDIWAVGQNLLVHYDGTAWTKVTPAGVAADFFSIWGFGPNNVYAVGGNGNLRTVAHWNGSSWSTENAGTDSLLYSIWGASPADLWATGSSGAILHKVQ